MTLPNPRTLTATLLLASSGALLLAGAMPTRTVLAHQDPKPQPAELFASSGCTQCHGETGLGTAKGPSLRDVRKRLTAEQVHTQIKDGGKSMPPFADALDDAQITSLVEFLRAKKPWNAWLPAWPRPTSTSRSA